MSTGYKINGIDIDELFESFPKEFVALYGVNSSRFTDQQALFKINGLPISEATGKIFPTSAGNSIGGLNYTSAYKINGAPIDVALKGCRPIGIHLADLTPGVYFLNRINGQTWVSSVKNSASGNRLQYDPKYMHIEVVGGGGGGGGSAALYASAGGGGGGYCYASIAIPENSFLQFVVGNGGQGGDARNAGANGGESKILASDGTVICQASGGTGGGVNNESGGQGGSAFGGKINISGGLGGSKEHGGGNVSQFNVILDKPEGTIWSRGGFAGGSSRGNNYGGGGGASAFSQGVDANTETTPAGGSYGAGGAGAGFKAATSSRGGNGGDGLIKLYY